MSRTELNIGIKTPKITPCYRQSIVVFLDVLGFKDRIKTAKTKDEVKNIFDILTYINMWNTGDGLNMFIEEKDFCYESYLLNKNIDYSKIKSELNISYFSDSLVVTLPYDEAEFNNKLFLIIRSTAYLISKLAMVNFFIRGGISIGKMFHEDNVFFGPAFLSAYDLEEKNAHYPRVVLSSELDSKLNNFSPPIPYLVKAQDGLTQIDLKSFINNFINYSKFSSPIAFEPIINNVNDNIVLNQNNFDIKAKYEWLKSQLK